MRPLGSLEERVMEIVWRFESLSVREVCERLGRPMLAYTTVMTTLARLYTKGLLDRSRDGLAYRYRARLSRAEYNQRLVGAAVSTLIARPTDAAAVLAAFVDAATELDPDNLSRLEALIAERKARGE
jgi:predicted transcriptional regulator